MKSLYSDVHVIKWFEVNLHQTTLLFKRKTKGKEGNTKCHTIRDKSKFSFCNQV